MKKQFFGKFEKETKDASQSKIQPRKHGECRGFGGADKKYIVLNYFLVCCFSFLLEFRNVDRVKRVPPMDITHNLCDLRD